MFHNHPKIGVSSSKPYGHVTRALGVHGTAVVRVHNTVTLWSCYTCSRCTRHCGRSSAQYGNVMVVLHVL